MAVGGAEVVAAAGAVHIQEAKAVAPNVELIQLVYKNVIDLQAWEVLLLLVLSVVLVVLLVYVLVVVFAEEEMKAK